MTVFDIKNSRNYAAVVREGAMRVFPVVSSHSDWRRDLTAFRPSPDFPHSAESKVIVTKANDVKLGNHSHSHVDGFFLVAGSCVVRTWTSNDGVQQQKLVAPIMFMFERGEEHILTCSVDTILVGYMPVTFEEENNTSATHL